MRIAFAQFRQCGAKSCHPKIFRAARSPDPVHKRAEIDQFRSRLHKIKIEDLLPCHIEGILTAIWAGINACFAEETPYCKWNVLVIG
jgi:hypothetical protein